MSRPMLGDGMYVARSQAEVCCLSEGGNGTKSLRNRHPATNMRLIFNHPAIKSIPVKRDWACDARGASRQEMVFARLL